MRKILVLWLVIMSLVLVACGGGDTEPAPADPEAPAEEPAEEPAAEPAAQVDAEPAKLGVLIPLTGPLAEFGPAFQDAAELARQHLSAGGYEVELFFADTETAPAPAVEAARRLVEVEGVDALVGAASSGVTIPVAESVAIPNEVPLISYASTSPLITNLPTDDGADFVFRTAPSDALQGVVLASLAEAEGYDNVSVLYVNNPYGQGLNDVFTANFSGTVNSVAHNEEATTTYVAELREVASDEGGVLVALGYPEHAGVYLREAVEGDFFDTFLFVDGTKSTTMIEQIGADVLDGQCGTAPGSVEGTSLDAFNSEFEAAFGEVPPQPFMTNVYDAVIVAALAAYDAQLSGEALSGVSVRDHLRTVATGGEAVTAGAAGIARAIELITAGEDVNYEGSAGSLDFDENGDVATPIEIWCYEGGEIVSNQLVEPGADVAAP